MRSGCRSRASTATRSPTARSFTRGRRAAASAPALPLPADRFVCPAGGFAAATVAADLDYRPRRCIYSPPQGGRALRAHPLSRRAPRSHAARPPRALRRGRARSKRGAGDDHVPRGRRRRRERRRITTATGGSPSSSTRASSPPRRTRAASPAAASRPRRRHRVLERRAAHVLLRGGHAVKPLRRSSVCRRGSAGAIT